MVEFGVVADALVVVLSLVAFVATSRMPNLFARGASARPLRLLAASFLLVAVAESAHILVDVRAVDSALGILHETFEAAFFVVLIVAGQWFLRAWRIPEEAPPTVAAAGNLPVPETLARILNATASEMAAITGPAFAYGLCRRAAAEALATSDDRVWAAVRAHLRPEMVPT